MKKDISAMTDEEFDRMFDSLRKKEEDFRKSCTPRKKTKSDPKYWEKMNERRIRETFHLDLDQRTYDIIEEINNKNIQ